VKIAGSALMLWLQFGSAQGASLDCNESDSYLYKFVGSAPALIAGMDCWHSVRLQPELLGAGGIFDIGCVELTTTRCGSKNKLKRN